MVPAAPRHARSIVGPRCSFRPCDEGVDLRGLSGCGPTVAAHVGARINAELVRRELLTHAPHRVTPARGRHLDDEHLFAVEAQVRRVPSRPRYPEVRRHALLQDGGIDGPYALHATWLDAHDEIREPFALRGRDVRHAIREPDNLQTDLGPPAFVIQVGFALPLDPVGLLDDRVLPEDGLDQRLELARTVELT